MNTLEITAPNPKSVSVSFSSTGILKIEGVSCDEDPRPLYSSLQNWVNDYLLQPAPKTELFIRLKYFNTSSAKCLYDLMENFKALSAAGKQLAITWYYEPNDEDMFETIKSFEDAIKLEIQKVKVNSYTSE